MTKTKLDDKITANITVAVAGNPKTGKTHFALTFPDPIAVFSFDMGCRLVAKKFPDKKVDILEYDIPIVDTLGLKDAGFDKLWRKIYEDFQKTIASGKYRTIVIDTGTHLWEIIRYAWNEENDRTIGEGGRARNYGEPNKHMYGIFMRAQVAGINLITTHHLKDKWVNDQNTGEQVLDGWRRTEGLADVILATDRVQKGKDFVIETTILASRFGLELCGYKQENMAYADLAALLEI